MANPEHLAKLIEGVEVWNAWREENEGVWPDLNGANLTGAKLTGAHLSGAKLRRANLRGAILNGASLTGASLIGAILTGASLRWADLTGVNLNDAHLNDAHLTRANLSGADLIGANLSKANLNEANLTGAHLTGADLQGANLQGANLTGAHLTGAKLNGAVLALARFGNTTITDTYLDKAEDLDTCVHDGPSIIDSHTLAQSPNLPLVFLKGIGLTSLITGDRLTIEFTSARYGQLLPIEFALRTRLGENYIVEKDADRIVVRLDSPEQFQAALEAVIPVLMALEAASPRESKRLSVEPKEGPSEQIESEELMAVLLYLVQRFDQEHPQAKLTASQEAIVETVKGGLRGVLGLALQKFFEASAAERELPIYQRFKPALEGLKGVAELPAHEEEPPKQLPPAPDEGT